MADAVSWSREILITALFAAGGRALWYLLAFAAAFAVIALGAKVPPGRWRTVASWASCAAAAGLGVYLAISHGWLCDDAYISFRYAKNFANGHGLVFNPGEWVEGYTNFLWTLFLGLLAKLGVDIPSAALAGNLACFVGTLLTARGVVQRVAPERPTFPFSALALAVTYPMTTYATSGLETAACALAALSAVSLLVSQSRYRFALSGAVFALDAMLRPDQVLLALGAGVSIVLLTLLNERSISKAARRALELGLPFLALFGVYFQWRYRAYGELYPNTYYAKSGGLTYVDQGLPYFVLFLVTSGGLVWLPLCAAVGRWRLNERSASFVFPACTGALLLCAYVVKVGGDFMLDRFFVPVVPLLAVSAELLLRQRVVASSTRSWRIATATAGALALCAAVVPITVIQPLEKRWNVAEEDSFYPIASWKPLRVSSGLWDLGETLKRTFTDRNLRPTFATGCIGMPGYLSDLPIVDRYGLTSRRIAHKPIARRARPGHEKLGDLTDLLVEGAELGSDAVWSGHSEDFKLVVDGKTYYLYRWNRDVMEALRRVPGAQVPNIRVQAVRAAGLPFFASRLEAFDDYSVLLAKDPAKDAMLAQLQGSLELVPLAGATLSGNIRPLAVERADETRVVRGFESFDEDGGGRGRVSIPLPRSRANEVRFQLWVADGMTVSARVTDGTEVLWSSAVAHEGGGWVTVSAAWPVAPNGPLHLELDDTDAARGHGFRMRNLHSARERDDIRDLLLRKRDAVTLAAAEEELSADDPALLAFRGAFPLVLRFDDAHFPPGMTVTGGAFGSGPAPQAVGDQQPVAGKIGAGFADSYHGGDGATGELRIPLPPGPATLIVNVGGSDDCEHAFVGIEAKGKIVARVCGKKDEVLREQRLPYTATEGDHPTLVIADRSSDAWGHILADEIVVERAPSPAVATH